MESFVRLIEKLSRNLDRAAGWALVAIMLLVVGNVILRLLGHPIEGTYELVCFLASMSIGLALAQCALEDGHLSITFLVDRLPRRLGAIILFCGYAVTVVFLAFTAWAIGRYATSMVSSGEVGMNTHIPFYPFIYLITLGFLVFCLVIFIKLGALWKEVAKR